MNALDQDTLVSMITDECEPAMWKSECVSYLAHLHDNGASLKPETIAVLDHLCPNPDRDSEDMLELKREPVNAAAAELLGKIYKDDPVRSYQYFHAALWLSQNPVDYEDAATADLEREEVYAVVQRMLEL